MKETTTITDFKDLRKIIGEVTTKKPAKTRYQQQAEKMGYTKDPKVVVNERFTPDKIRGFERVIDFYVQFRGGRGDRITSPENKKDFEAAKKMITAYGRKHKLNIKDHPRQQIYGTPQEGSSAYKISLYAKFHTSDPNHDLRPLLTQISKLKTAEDHGGGYDKPINEDVFVHTKDPKVFTALQKIAKQTGNKVKKQSGGIKVMGKDLSKSKGFLYQLDKVDIPGFNPNYESVQIDEGIISENYRTLARKGMGAETRKSIKVGTVVDFYDNNGNKREGTIIKLGPIGDGYTLKDNKDNKVYKFKYLDRMKAKKLLAAKNEFDKEPLKGFPANEQKLDEAMSKRATVQQYASKIGIDAKEKQWILDNEKDIIVFLPNQNKANSFSFLGYPVRDGDYYFSFLVSDKGGADLQKARMQATMANTRMNVLLQQEVKRYSNLKGDSQLAGYLWNYMMKHFDKLPRSLGAGDTMTREELAYAIEDAVGAEIQFESFNTSDSEITENLSGIFGKIMNKLRNAKKKMKKMRIGFKAKGMKEDKLDPVGKADDDIDNDGDTDDSDAYLKNRRKKISKAIKMKESHEQAKRSPFKLKSQAFPKAVGIETEGFGTRHAIRENIVEACDCFGMITEQELQVEQIQKTLGKLGFLTYNISELNDVFDERETERMLLALESVITDEKLDVVNYTRTDIDKALEEELEVDFVKPDGMKARGPVLKMCENTYNLKDKHTGKSFTFKYEDSDMKTFNQVISEAKFPKKLVRMAGGIAFDKRYVGGNMTGAVKAIEKIKKGLSDDPEVKRMLRLANESFNNEFYNALSEKEQTAYQKFFMKTLKKFNVSSPAELKGDKEKEFYNFIDKNWSGKKETDENKKVKVDPSSTKIDGRRTNFREKMRKLGYIKAK